MADQFGKFAQKCKEISGTKSNNEKVKIVVNYLSELSFASLPIAVSFFSGKLFAAESGLSVKVAYSTIMSAISEISDISAKEANRVFLQHGDLGYLVEYSLSQKAARLLIEYSPLTLESVYHTLVSIAKISGHRSQEAKKKALAGLILRCTPLEGKYLSKILTNELRIGLSEGLLLNAISKSFGVSLNSIQNSLLMTGNISQISLLAKKNMLHTAKMQPLSPVSFMLADVMYSPSEIVNYFHKDLVAEYKYDGIRAQLHIQGKALKLFSRNLNDITSFFPELVPDRLDPINAAKLILDGEILAFKNGKVGSFQYLQTRLHVKNVSQESIESVPVIYVIFDALYIDRELINKPLLERKEILSTINFSYPFSLAEWKLIGSETLISKLFEKSKNLGYEGLVLKDPDSEYQIGKRGRKWIKFKKELDTLDVIVVMAEYGHGKRAGVLSDYTFAVKKSPSDDRLLTIGKAYSGLTDKEIGELTSELKSIAVKTDGYRIWVEPKIVLEISFDNIQKSDRHKSGYALRFPRIKTIRRDKNVRDIDDLGKVVDTYSRQHK